MSSHAERIAGLSPAKLARLTERLKGGVPDAARAQRIARRPADVGPPPLSFAQQRLWFLDQLAPGSAAYNVSSAIRLEGRLDVSALARSLSEIVRRHESLRTAFAVVGGQPVQVVAPDARLDLKVISLEELPAAAREAAARELAHDDALRPFDLSRGSLVRATLARLGDDSHLALFTLHHIISDGWSFGVLVRELAALYQSFAAGEPSPLAELPVQYADYAVWQRARLQGDELERLLTYWRAQLAGVPILELPTDNPRPATQGFRGKTQTFTLPRELRESLTDLGRSEGATLFMTLLAAFQTLLARYSGQEDVAVGTPIAGRQRLETENLIGFFVNTLVLRSDLSGDPSFRELLRRVREVTLGAYAHQDLPFERLVEELQPDRSMSRAPLFQVLFALQNAPSSSLVLPGLRLTSLPPDAATAKFDLTLIMHETESGLAGSLNYDADLFDDATAARLITHFERLLRGVAAEPDRSLSELSLLSPSERRQLLVEWNDTRSDYPRESGLHELFEAQAAERPDAVAIVHAAGQMTYGELNARANRLAHRLIKLGVGPEVVVGICAERGPELIVGLLGILKAGGAYLPLDPAHPRERLSFMLKETRARLLLTQQRLRAALPADGPPVISLDADRPAVARERADNPGVRVRADNLAYVTYTSGSTGRPKGVAVTQRGVARLVKRSDYAAFGPEEVFLQFAPVAFDASTFEVWGSLLNGARLVLMPPGTRTLAELGQTLRAQGVTTLWLTAGLFHLMTDEHAEDLRGVRQLLAGGDVLSPAHVQKFLRAADPGSTLVNGYGPTENTTFTCCHPMRAGAQFDQTVPIGRPVAQTQVYVLDADLQPVPVGVVGELYAGGDGLARGYVNRPQLTAERFIPHPFGAEPGQRLYRTGDMARHLPDGALEFLGRRDGQVKVRGFRIEPGEVEAALRDCGGVREAVVVARAGEGGESYLAAYLLAEPQVAANVAGLRLILKERLPDYMIPASFVFLEEFPLTPRGKVDRRALPEPSRAKSEGAQSAPLDPVEEILAGIWAEVLRLEVVGREANFFELGGHSLLATQLISRARAAFGVELPLGRLFEEPTVAGLARVVRGEMAAGRGPEAHAITRAGRASAPPLSFAQERFWFLDQLEPGNSRYNIPLAVRLAGALDAAALEGALAELVRRHEILRTTFAQSGGQPVQIIAPEARVALDATDFSGLAAGEREAEARRLVVEEAGRPFDLARGPLLRARLIRLGAEDHILCLVLHHIIADGWSLGVLMREVAALYAAARTGEPASLPELPVQYADYSIWQRERLRGGELERQLDYWRARLAGAPPVLELPTDKPRPPAQTFRGRTQAFALTQELSAALRELGRREGVTLFMTLLAGFKVLLARYAGQEDFVLGAGIANRNSLATEGLIGCFVNFLPLRADLARVQTVRELLRAVREEMLAAHAHQDIPFEVLLEKLRPERRPGHPPLFQVTFFFQNVPRPNVELPGLSLKPLSFGSSVAKFDLMLVMDERPEGIAGAFEYNVDLFDDATVARLIAHFENLLRDAAAHPDKEIRGLTMVTDEETRGARDAFNDDFE
jgi:amino acid adenylation domain-containing protein